MSSNREHIPLYASDGTSLGFRSLEAAKRLVAGRYVKPAYGRKGHLKAIFLQGEGGSDPVDTRARNGTRYSFLQRLDNGGRCWELRRMDGRDEDGLPVNTRGVFLQVIKECQSREVAANEGSGGLHGRAVVQLMRAEEG